MLVEKSDAHSVENVVKLSCDCGVLRNLARESKGGCVEQAPCGLVAPVVGRLLPFTEHLCDARHVDDVAPVELHDGLVCSVIVERGALVQLDGAVLCLTFECQGFHDLRDERGEFMLRTDGVLALHHVVGTEGHVVTDEHPRTEGDADGEVFVVAVPQSDGIGVVTVL